MTEPRSGHVKSVRTTIRVIEALYHLDGAGVSDLADHLDVAKSSAHRHLTTLQAANYVVRENEEYYLSLQFLELGDYVQDRKPIHRLAEPKVEELSDETGERAQFVVEEHGYVRYVHTATGAQAVKTTAGYGKRIRMHAVAAGKAILAHLPEADVEEILDRRGLPSYTENTITDRESLSAELETVRERGVSYDDEEFIEGLRAIGVPVRDEDGTAIGALTVAGPTHRMKDDRFEGEIPDLLLAGANELELKIAYE